MKNWSEMYQIGIKRIDEQHRGFFELWDKELKNADMDDSVCLSCILKKLEKYITDHFTFEENMMKESGYKDAQKHMAMHKYFIQRVNEMKLEFKYMNPLLFEKVTDFMKKWLLHHIMQVDKKCKETFVNYYNEQGEYSIT